MAWLLDRFSTNLVPISLALSIQTPDETVISTQLSLGLHVSKATFINHFTLQDVSPIQDHKMPRRLYLFNFEYHKSYNN